MDGWIIFVGGQIFLKCLMIFLSPNPDVIRMSMLSFFPRTTRLWNYLPPDCFPLICNVNGCELQLKKVIYKQI